MVVLMCGAHAHAQCTMDRECKRDRICENGSCVDPSPAAPPVTTAPKPQASAAPPTATPVRATPRSPPPSPPKQPQLVPHSEDMVAAGIGSVALAGVGFIVAVGSFFEEAGCGAGNIGSLGSSGCGSHDSYIYGGLLSTVILAGVGIPLIVLGSRREPASPEHSATVSPWVGRQSAGLSLRFEL